MTREMAEMRALQNGIPKFGIKQKILVVLVSVLLLTTALEAALASYYTNRQNQQAAFTSLGNQLFAWQSALQATTQQLTAGALATMGDTAVLDQLAELLTLQFNVDDRTRAPANGETARALAYRKTVSLNRLQLALRTGGFSSIAVYTHDKLSHYVSASAAGMTVTRADGGQAWVSTTMDADGNLPFQRWPAWLEHPVPPLESASVPAPVRPSINFVFSEPQEMIIEIAVPIQGLVDDSMTDAPRSPVLRFFSGLTIAGTAQNGSIGNVIARPPEGSPRIVAVVVFRRIIDRASLQMLAGQTANIPMLLSSDGRHSRRLSDIDLIPPDLLAQAQSDMTASSPRAIQSTVTTGRKSFYVALLPWQFDDGPRLILGLAAPRDITLQNIRQTVAAILLVAGVILLLSVTIGILWVEKFIEPIVQLTSAVKDIASRNRFGSNARRDNPQPVDTLQTIDIQAPDEVGALAQAFNAMIVTLARQEADLVSANAGMAAVLARMSAILDNIPDLAWVKDIDGRYIAANQVLARSLRAR
jgi:PAS domain-containing protein